MAAVDVVPLSPQRRDEWNRFVDASNNGTAFHRLDFLDYHPAGRFDFRHLMFCREGRLLAVLPGGVKDGAYRSPTGASFGGFAVPRWLPLAQAHEVVQAFCDWCGANNVREALLTPPMSVYHDIADESMDYALIYNGFAPRNPLYSSVADCGRFFERGQMDGKIRYNLNKAQREGVSVSESTDLAAFYPILVDNKAKFQARPTHTLEELQRIETLMPGMMKLFLADYQGAAVGGVLLFLANKTCGLNFYTMHRYEHRRLHATSLLVEAAMCWCHQHGYHSLDFGVSADTFSSNPLEPSWSLVDFKESLRYTGCIRRSYYRSFG